jgi:hypothetical protein
VRVRRVTPDFMAVDTPTASLDVRASPRELAPLTEFTE